MAKVGEGQERCTHWHHRSSLFDVPSLLHPNKLRTEHKRTTRKTDREPPTYTPFTYSLHDAALHLNASPSPLRLGCNALSGLRTKWANCGFTPNGAEICISPPWGFTGKGGAKLLARLWRLNMPPRKTFFPVQSVAREYLLEGEMGGLIGEVVGEVVTVVW